MMNLKVRKSDLRLSEKYKQNNYWKINLRHPRLSLPPPLRKPDQNSKLGELSRFVVYYKID